jgi:hypothetical protein
VMKTSDRNMRVKTKIYVRCGGALMYRGIVHE